MDVVSRGMPNIEKTIYRKVSLQNALDGHKDFRRKIELSKLNQALIANHIFKPSYDLRKNPRQNYLEVTIHNIDEIKGNFWVFSNGTCKTNIGVTDEVLISLLDFFYKTYARDCLE